MKERLEGIRILADAMNYLDHTYCHGSIVDWIRKRPEGMAYSLVRRLFIEVVEESSTQQNAVLRAA